MNTPREPLDVDRLIRDAFLSHLSLANPPRDETGLPWVFDFSLAEATFNFRVQHKNELTSRKWSRSAYRGTATPDDVGIKQRFEELWQTDFDAQAPVLPGVLTTTSVWPRSTATSQDDTMVRQPLWWLDDRDRYPEQSGQISYFKFTSNPDDPTCISLPGLAAIYRYIPCYRVPFKRIELSHPPEGHPNALLESNFVLSFACPPKYPLESKFDLFKEPEASCTTTLRYQLRHFRPFDPRDLMLRLRSNKLKEGLRVHRQKARLGKSPNEYLRESVSSAIMFTHGSGARWGITVLSDEDLATNTNRLASVTGGSGRDSEQFFAAVLGQLFDHAEEGWNETLDTIHRLAGFTLDDFSSDDRKDKLMFDRSFDRSRVYFTGLQLLRLVDRWADENFAVLEKFEEGWKRKVRACEEVATRDNVVLDKECFKTTISDIKKRTDALHDRVRVLREDIAGLRDGLFNATSLREATQGTSLNMTLYLFTTVTIIYAPIGFLATFWAMPYLNNPAGPDGHVARPPHLLSSFIIVPLFTYIIAIAFALYFWPSLPRGQIFRGLFFWVIGRAIGDPLMWLLKTYEGHEGRTNARRHANGASREHSTGATSQMTPGDNGEAVEVPVGPSIEMVSLMPPNRTDESSMERGESSGLSAADRQESQRTSASQPVPTRRLP